MPKAWGPPRRWELSQSHSMTYDSSFLSMGDTQKKSPPFSIEFNDVC